MAGTALCMGKNTGKHGPLLHTDVQSLPIVSCGSAPVRVRLSTILQAFAGRSCSLAAPSSFQFVQCVIVRI